MNNPIEDFWGSIRGLVCVCNRYDCGNEDCRLIKHEKEEKRKLFLRHFKDKKDT